MNSSVLGEAMKNVRKHRDLKLFSIRAKFFTEHLLAIDMQKKQQQKKQQRYL